MNTEAEIAITGTGPAGLITALCLARAGHSVELIGPEVDHADPRTTALMQPSLGVLEKIGLRQAIEAAGAPLRVMRIADGTNRLVRSPAVSFHASDIGETAFGYNIPNTTLNAHLDEAVSAQVRISRRVTKAQSYSVGETAVRIGLADGAMVDARLVVGADGRGSAARHAAGIRHEPRKLPQSALVLTFRHGAQHEFVSTEIHTESGPFTQVPLPDPNRSSLVWVVAPHEAERLRHLDDGTLAELIERRMQSMLGPVTIDSQRAVFPLATALPLRFADNRIALVGEAAHVFPPIGAQGLNLAVRDGADLVRILPPAGADPGSQNVLSAYNRARRSDIVLRSAAVRSLNRSLLTDMLPVQLARAGGLDILRRFSPLREFFMREGMSPGSGFRAVRRQAVDTLREQVDRYRAGPHQGEDRGHGYH